MFVIAGTYILAKIDFLSVCPSVCLSVCPPVRLSACPSVRLSVCPPVRLSACPSVCLSVCPPVRLSACPSVRLSVCISVRLSICPSVHLFVCFIPNVFESIQLPAVNLFVPLFVYPCILSFFQSVKVNVGLLTSLPIHSSVDSSTLFWILSVCSLFVCLSILLVSSYVF